MTQAPRDPAGPPRSRRPGAALRVGVATLAVALLAGAAYWQFFRPRAVPPPPANEPPAEGALPPDPRLAYQGPFHNVRPDVAYVGDAKCAECHADIAHTFSQ